MRTRMLVRRMATVRGRGALLALGLCATPLGFATANELPVRAVTLSSGGVAEIRHGGSLDGSGSLRLEVPLEQVDDILKSLVVHDGAGRLVGLSLDGPSAVEETFRRLPFDPGTLEALGALANSLQGVPVRVAAAGRSVEGRLLGVEARPVGEGEAQEEILSVLDGEGRVATLRLGPEAQLEILDEALRERLREALEVSGRGRIEEMRELVIELEGEGEREVGLAYVVAAPVWKSTYRLLLDEEGESAYLQGWAVVENAGASDWDGVELTLSSGAPVTLTQRLLQRYWHQRPEVPVSVEATAPPRPDPGVLRDERRDAGQQVARFSGAAGAAAPSLEAAVVADAPPPAAPAHRAVAQQGDTVASWRLPFPVDLPAGRTLSLPYVDDEVPAERLSVFQPERDEMHPVAAVRLENTTSTFLPAGLATVYEASGGAGYVGDVQLPGIPAGESRMASFAADRQLRVASEASPEERLERVVVVDGTLRATRLSRITTRYEVRSDARSSRRLVIEHPRRAGWEFSSEALVESTLTHRRLAVTLAPGDEVRIEAVEERTREESVALVDVDGERLLRWSDAADPQTAGILATLIEHRRALAEAETELETLEREIARAVQRQERLRENLAAVGADSDLGQRYLADLEAQEQRIGEFEDRREEAEARHAERREALAAFLREL